MKNKKILNLLIKEGFIKNSDLWTIHFDSEDLKELSLGNPNFSNTVILKMISSENQNQQGRFKDLDRSTRHSANAEIIIKAIKQIPNFLAIIENSDSNTITYEVITPVLYNDRFITFIFRKTRTNIPFCVTGFEKDYALIQFGKISNRFKTITRLKNSKVHYRKSLNPYEIKNIKNQIFNQNLNSIQQILKNLNRMQSKLTIENFNIEKIKLITPGIIFKTLHDEILLKILNSKKDLFVDEKHLSKYSAFITYDIFRKHSLIDPEVNAYMNFYLGIDNYNNNPMNYDYKKETFASNETNFEEKYKEIFESVYKGEIQLNKSSNKEPAEFMGSEQTLDEVFETYSFDNSSKKDNKQNLKKKKPIKLKK